MPNYIVKLNTPAGPRYLDYSTVVDAPITYGMTLDEYKAYYRDKYGEHGMSDLEKRLERVEARGTSSLIHANMPDLVRDNRAGKDDTRLNIDQFVDYYAVRQGEGEQPTGKDINATTRKKKNK